MAFVLTNDQASVQVTMATVCNILVLETKLVQAATAGTRERLRETGDKRKEEMIIWTEITLDKRVISK